jgi:hypothetical protein
MAKLVVTLTRVDLDQPWFKVTREMVLTWAPADALAVETGQAAVEALPGLITIQEHLIDDYTAEIVHDFDTLEHAKALAPPTDPAILARGEVVTRKRKEAGVFYKVHPELRE